MESQEFLRQFADAMEVDPGQIGFDTVFKDRPEWDSLAALNVIAMVDELMGKSIAGNDLATAVTIGDLWATISR
jgi:acyl carrier protein